jgi:hypothetical protein
VDRESSFDSIRAGLFAAALAILVFGGTFLFAIFYIA